MQSALRVAVVGGSSGLGRCIGTGLAEKGAQVAFVARRRDRLENAAKEAGTHQPRTRIDQCGVEGIEVFAEVTIAAWPAC